MSHQLALVALKCGAKLAVRACRGHVRRYGCHLRHQFGRTLLDNRAAHIMVLKQDKLTGSTCIFACPPAASARSRASLCVITRNQARAVSDRVQAYIATLSADRGDRLS